MVRVLVAAAASAGAAGALVGEGSHQKMTLLLLKEALLCYRSRCFFCCSCIETARSKGGNGGRGAAVGIYQTAKKKRYFAAILAKQMPEIVRSLDNGAQR